MKITLYGRQSNSGTYTFLQEHVMGNKPYSTDMKEMNGNAQIIEGVLSDESAIGYVGVGYVVDKATGKPMKGLKVLNISKDAKGRRLLAPGQGHHRLGKVSDLPAALSGHERQAQGPDLAAFITWDPERRRSEDRRTRGLLSDRAANARPRTPRT